MRNSTSNFQSLLYIQNTIITGLMASALLLTSPLPVLAQGELEEIVVTARYREENLQETPLAISAITAEDLEVRAMTASYEVGYSIPNASLRPAQAAFGNTMTAFIRGIGQNDFNFAFEPGVGIYFDDVYFPTTMGSMIDLMDMERVEVLRGPQGTLFGRGSIGGAIRMISKKPQGDNTGFIQATGGDYRRVDLRASYDFSITENLFARVTGVSKHRQGYIDRLDFTCVNPTLAGTLPRTDPNRGNNCKLGTLGGQDVQGTRGSLRWVPSDDLEITVTADYMDDASEGTADTIVSINTRPPYSIWNAAIVNARYGINYDSRFVPSDPYVSYATFDDKLSGLNFVPETTMEQWGTNIKIEWDLNEDMGVEAILARREYSGKFSTDHDVSPVNGQLVNGEQDYEFWTAEIRLNGRAFERLEYTLGFFHFESEVLSTQIVSFPSLCVVLPCGVGYPTAPGSGILVTSFNTGESENNSFYGHGVYDLTDRFSFSAGFRYSDDTKDAGFDNTVIIDTLSASGDRWDYKFGLDFKVTDDILVYASTATGFRPSAYNPRPFQAPQFVSVDGEEAESYDIGIKGDFFDNRFRVNMAGFFIDYTQRIVAAGGTQCPVTALGGSILNLQPGSGIFDSAGNECGAPPVPLTNYINSPGEIYGFEIEAQLNLIDNLTISGVFGMIDWSSEDTLNAETDAPVYVPDQNWSISASYDFNLANGGTFTPRVDVFGQSTICTSAVTLNSCSDGYEIVNVRLDWLSPSADWQAAFGVTNVTDKLYYLNRFDLQAFGQPFTQAQPGPPSQWYFTVRRNFN